ncbi:CvpA family protein [Ferviditalea candida]|uniref:CvpA family protein n=1 Tax=Ferviditalea candida TaxID=3108399 RepID=A0ABU5ZF09_9BACL|nr:CvpA family protein [Paenibacillaceae bacterium T2]
MNLNWVDYVIIGLLVGGFLMGYVRGFVSQLLSIFGTVIAFIAAFRFYGGLSPWIAQHLPISSLGSFKQYAPFAENMQLDKYFYNALAFALIFFGSKIVLSIVGGVLNVIAKIPGIHFVNKWSGAVLAFVEVLAMIVIAVNLLAVTPVEKLKAALEQSVIVTYILHYAPYISPLLQDLWKHDPAIPSSPSGRLIRFFLNGLL